MPNKISEFDKRIVGELESRGILGYDVLADSYGVSARTVYRRMKHLSDIGAIRLIVAPNFLLLGYKIWARIGLCVYPGQLHHVADTLVKDPRIYFVGYTLGRYDIMLSVYFKNIDELANFVNDELVKNRGVRTVETMLLVQPRKYNLLTWPEPVYETNKSIFNNSDNQKETRYELDGIERNILEILMSRGPVRPKELATALDTSETAVRNRLRKMQKVNLYRVEVVPIGEELESGNRATIGITVYDHSPHKVINKLLLLPEVFLASLTLGRFNIILGTRFRNIVLLNQFVSEVLPSMAGISSIETYLHIRRVKYYSVLESIWSVRFN